MAKDVSPNPNMRIWDQVCSTDPAHTKPVCLGRTFTAIDPQYQIQMATEALGPIGIGWGYSAEHCVVAINDIEHAVADVALWVRDETSGEIRNYGPIRAMSSMFVSPKNKDRIDLDAPKKATTDAITKLLSQIGVSADVFLGKFDDNRYVAEQRARHGGDDNPVEPDMSHPSNSQAPANAGLSRSTQDDPFA